MSRTIPLAALCLVATVAWPSAATSDTDALAEITIVQRYDGAAPTHFAPSTWTCTSSDVSSVYTVSCTPTAAAPSGNWVCPSPRVLTSYLGSPLDTVDTAVECGTTTAGCAPQQLPSFAGFCDETAAGPAAMPFRCVADYSGTTVATVEWTVLCRTYHS